MISQDMRNLARSFGGLSAGCATVTLTAEDFLRLAIALDDLADRTALLEAVAIPAQARPVPATRTGTVVPFSRDRSRPWGGNPPGKPAGPDKGDAA